MTTTETVVLKVKDKTMDEIFEEVNTVIANVFGHIENIPTEPHHQVILSTYVELFGTRGCPIHHYERVIESIKTKIPMIRDGKSLEIIIKKTAEMYREQKHADIMHKIHLYRTLSPEQLRELHNKNLQNHN